MTRQVMSSRITMLDGGFAGQVMEEGDDTDAARAK